MPDKMRRVFLILISQLITGLLASTTAQDYRSIKKVETVRVEVPEGNVPRLPYQLWVDYSDGKGEYRQVKWLNSSQATEAAEANPDLNPVGTIYKVRGMILGDNTTPNGYPVSAEVKVTDGMYAVPSHIPVAKPLPLNEVSIDGDNRPEADGWDSPTTKLKGHGSGHYMSALAFAFASCQDKSKKALLKNRIIEMVNGLRECQERTFVWNQELGRYWEARDFAP